ncbi:MAG: hypothetical protein ACFFBW_17030 [Promethearchaeota archaeon]
MIKSIDFEKVNKTEALIRMRSDVTFFLAALVKMKMVDNFDHTLPSGLTSFAEFYFSYHDIIYKNEDVPNKIYSIFLKWLNNLKALD